MAEALVTPKKIEPPAVKAVRDIRKAVGKKKYSELTAEEKDQLLCAVALRLGLIEEA